MVKESISLFFKEGSSDKFYDIQIEETNGKCSVPFVYGRMGTAGQSGVKVSGVSYEEAKKAYDKVVKEKIGKGYQEKGGAKLTTHAAIPTTKIKSGIIPQLLNFIPEEEAARLILNKKYGAQEKKDGKRMLLSHKDGQTKASNKKGIECSYPAPYESDMALVLKHSRLDTITLDGEAVGDTYWVFDVLTTNTNSQVTNLREMTYEARYTYLAGIVPDSCKHIKILPLAKTTKEKQSLLDSLRAAGKEGIVFKNLEATYKPGRPNSGGDQLKYKFYATATCLVARLNAKNSVSLTMFVEGSPIDVGNVTTIGKKVAEGDFIEVRYLYAYKGGSLYQPIFVGVRDDADISDCDICQLKYKAEE
jgi:bifunctional non-homologous end joining protein LigD